MVMIQSQRADSTYTVKLQCLAKAGGGGVCVQLMSDHPARQGPGSVLDQVPLPVDVCWFEFYGKRPYAQEMVSPYSSRAREAAQR